MIVYIISPSILLLSILLDVYNSCFIYEYYIYVYEYFFQFWIITNIAATYTFVGVFVQINVFYFSWVLISRSEISVLCSKCMFNIENSL